ncbi:putative DNA methylase, C-5 cytosine-specific, active [Helianthus anomalus]
MIHSPVGYGEVWWEFSPLKVLGSTLPCGGFSLPLGISPGGEPRSWVDGLHVQAWPGV